LVKQERRNKYGVNKTFFSTCAELELGGSEKEPCYGNYLEKVLDIFISHGINYLARGYKS
jgi:hypothetical protein